MSWLNGLFVALSLLLLLPVAWLTLQVLMGIKERKPPLSFEVDDELDYVVLMPAHNEEQGIAECLIALKSVMSGRGRILVIADNCSDRTAEIARQQDVLVLERESKTERGKSFALAFGIDYLRNNAPNIVIVLDADTQFSKGTPLELAKRAKDVNAPVQCLNILKAPSESGLMIRIAAFAWLVKNRLRTVASSRLSMPCQLAGTGMAFPWQLIANANIANGSIVEDLQLGVDLAFAGFWPHFEDQIEVVGYFPSSQEGLAIQRRRWEHGHIAMMLVTVPNLILKAAQKGSYGLLAMALDIAVPPLALLLMLLVTWLSICAIYGFGFHFWYPFLITLHVLLLMLLSIILAWFFVARHLLSLTELALAPWYALRKIPVYIGFFIARQTEWIRTKRD